MWKKSSTRYTGVGKEADSVTYADERAERNGVVKYLSEDRAIQFSIVDGVLRSLQWSHARIHWT